MKKLILALALIATPVMANTPIDGKREHIENHTQAQAAAELVKAYGYRCDSISSFQSFIMGGGYKINCNSFRYTYELEDKGGRWVVTVK